MRDFSSPTSLAGSLLLAHPALSDPNFRRTVVYVAAHTEEEGAFGIVLNRAMGKRAADIAAKQPLGALGKAPVFIGGPVGMENLVFMSFDWNEEEESVIVRPNLSVGEAEACVEEGVSVRGFVGYAGWSAGQLEAEMEQGGWIVRPASREVVEVKSCAELWQTTMRGLGPWFRLMAAAPDDPSRN